MGKKKMMLIGIDAGLHTGIAVAQNGKLIDVYTGTFWDAINKIRECRQMGLTVRIEDPGQISAMYFSEGKENRVAGARDPTAYRSKMAQHVGANKRDAQLIIEYCGRHGIPCIPQKPLKGAMSKIDTETFKRYTGWTKKTSQHARDSVMQIFGFIEGCK